MGRKKTLKLPALPAEETPHGWKWRKSRPPGAGRPPHLIDQCHRLTTLQLLDAHVEFTSVGRPPGPMRPLVVCPRCGARRALLYTRPGVGVGCRGKDCLSLDYRSEHDLKHPAASVERIAELVARFKAAKTRRSRERWRNKALAAGAEFMRRELVRQARREALLRAQEAAVAQAVPKEYRALLEGDAGKHSPRRAAE